VSGPELREAVIFPLLLLFVIRPFYNARRTLGIITGDSAFASPRKYGMSRISVRRVQK
jgi:hypothetical protein